MVCQLDVFLKIPNAAAGFVVRTIQSIVGPTADHNFAAAVKARFLSEPQRWAFLFRPGQLPVKTVDRSARPVLKYI